MAKQNTGPATSPTTRASGARRGAAPPTAAGRGDQRAERPERPATPPARAATARPREPREQSGLAARFAGLQKGFRETAVELRKVQWPDRMTTRNLTLVVIGMSVALSALLGLFDALLTRLFEWLIRI